MSDNDAGLSIIYTGGYVSDLAICIDPTDRFYGWLLAKNPLDGQWVSLAKMDANATNLHEAREKIATLERELEEARAGLLIGADMTTPQTTHWDGCATDGGPAHYECAVGRIRELEAELARVREALQPARDALAAIDRSTDEARQRTGRTAENACFYAAQRALMALDAARAQEKK